MFIWQYALMKFLKSPVAAQILLFLWVFILSLFFANVEIAIEGPNGWAANLPTWRIEHHWLLDIFWGGRAMTGYHAWVFPFIAMTFHLPVFFSEHWDYRKELTLVSCILFFWISEDFLWFVFNPAYTIHKFAPESIAWHKHWILFAPTDYWVAAVVISLFLYLANHSRQKN
jgi:hypothetical protein